MFTNYIIVDLTHNLNATIPVWPGDKQFEQKVLMDYDQGCRLVAYTMSAGLGTHIDAPAHFFKHGRTIDALTLDELVAPASVLDVCEKVAANHDYMISITDVKEWEQQHGQITKDAVVIGFTGWFQYWSDEQRYRNIDGQGIMHFPGFSKEAAELLIERDVAGIGIDTFSPDPGISTDFFVHHSMLQHNKYLIENLTNLDQLPSAGAFICALPIKITAGPEASARVIAFVPKD